MATTDTPPGPGRWKLALAASTAALARYRTGVHTRRHDLSQLIGAAAVEAGIYHGFGLTATLIIGGISVIVVSMLREGDRV